LKKIPKNENRNHNQLIQHYKTEKELATKLRNASKNERKLLYPRLYDELFTRVPHHPRLTRKFDYKLRRNQVLQQVNFLSKFCSPKNTFLELGAGDCALSFELCKYFKKVYAIDVSQNITASTQKPSNFELLISNGSSVDIQPETVDIAYSNQLMEHLHPDDAFDQLTAIYNVLVKGGIYICLTPHRFMGPSDISAYFDDVATGFHLKEYTNKELYCLFRRVGFCRIQSFFRIKCVSLTIPICPAIMTESLLNTLPHSLRRHISKRFLFRQLLSIELMATK